MLSDHPQLCSYLCCCSHSV